jgi:GTP-binding protein Era
MTNPTLTPITDADNEAHRCGFIAIVGRPNVGKSTLMNHLIGQKVSITSKKAQTTRHRVTGIHTTAAAQYIFVDTPGFQLHHGGALNETLNKSVKETLGDVDCVFFVVEALRYTDADKTVARLLPKNTPVILVINKGDKVADKYRLQDFIASMQSEFDFAGVEVVSAKHGQRLSDLMESTLAHLPESVPLYPEDMVTDKTTQFMLTEIVREKLFRYLGEELPYSMNVEIELFEETPTLISVHAVVLIDKESQKGIVIGSGGERLKKISTEARLDMEKQLDSKVFLKVWVKVKTGWADDVRFLKDFGLK